MTSNHCTTAQADRLAKCAGFVAWAEARGIHSLDRVEYDGEVFVYGGMDEDGEEWLWDINGHSCGNVEAADCRLLPSESDCLDYLRTLCHRVKIEVYADEAYVRLDNPTRFFSGGMAIGYKSITSGDGATLLDALIACIEAVEEVRERC